jgi:hypothetical protein
VDLVLQNGYSLILVIWGVAWLLGVAASIALLAKYFSAESRATAAAVRKAARAGESVEAAPARTPCAA